MNIPPPRHTHTHANTLILVDCFLRSIFGAGRKLQRSQKRRVKLPSKNARRRLLGNDRGLWADIHLLCLFPEGFGRQLSEFWRLVRNELMAGAAVCLLFLSPLRTVSCGVWARTSQISALSDRHLPSRCRIHGPTCGAGHMTSSCRRRLISGGLVDIKQGKGFSISGLIPLFSARKAEPQMS